jgi:uncharacterized protein (TIGR02246 family)
MKIRLAVVLVGLAISFVEPTFAQQKDTVDPKVEQQIRALAQKYDEAINKHDSVAIASLYAQNGVWRTYDHGSFYGQKAIEKAYARWVFTTWQVRNYLTSVNRIFARGNEIRSSGTWSCTFQNTSGGPANDEGRYSWVIVREGDTWKIRSDTASGKGSASSVAY